MNFLPEWNASIQRKRSATYSEVDKEQKGHFYKAPWSSLSARTPAALSSAWSFQILSGSCCSPLLFLPLLWLWLLLLVSLLLVPQSPAHGTWHQPSTPLLLSLPILHLIRATTYPRLGKELLWSNSIWAHLLSFTFFVYYYRGPEVALCCCHPSGAFHLDFLRPALSLAQSSPRRVS